MDRTRRRRIGPLLLTLRRRGECAPCVSPATLYRCIPTGRTANTRSVADFTRTKPPASVFTSVREAARDFTPDCRFESSTSGGNHEDRRHRRHRPDRLEDCRHSAPYRSRRMAPPITRRSLISRPPAEGQGSPALAVTAAEATASPNQRNVRPRRQQDIIWPKKRRVEQARRGSSRVITLESSAKPAIDQRR
jgi:hypothetical protein